MAPFATRGRRAVSVGASNAKRVVRGPSINTAAPAASGVSIGQDGRSVGYGPLLLPRVNPPSGPANGV